MITFVSFLWNETGRRMFQPWHVNILAGALKRYCDFPYRFVCITDEPGEYRDVEIIPLPRAAYELTRFGAPQGVKFPSCYRRLWLLSDEAKQLGDRLIQLDLDVVILGSMKPVVQVRGEFVAYHPRYTWGRGPLLNGSMWMLDAGSQDWLWQRFSKEPQKCIDHAKREGWMGSDQAILSCYLEGKARTWDNKALGIYAPEEGRNWHIPPKDARVVMFNGQIKPWNLDRLWSYAYCRHFGGLNEVRRARPVHAAGIQDAAAAG